MKPITLKSGNTLEVQTADFEPAFQLFQVSSAEIGDLLSVLKVSSLSTAMNQDIDPSVLLGAICRLISSKPVIDGVWECLKPCIYNGQKITRTSFQDEEARSDFLPCVVEVFKANVFPFIAGLDLKSFTSQAKTFGNLK